MLIKIFSFILLVWAVYTLSIFFAPAQADEIGALIGAPGFNDQVRSLKGRIDGVSDTLVELKNATGGILDDAGRVVDQARSVVGTTRDILDTKVNQTKQVVDSVNKLSDAASAVKSNIDALTTLSGATLSGSNQTTATVSGSLQFGQTATGTNLSASGTQNLSTAATGAIR